jgi:hypothetical protein
MNVAPSRLTPPTAPLSEELTAAEAEGVLEQMAATATLLNPTLDQRFVALTQKPRAGDPTDSRLAQAEVRYRALVERIPAVNGHVNKILTKGPWLGKELVGELRRLLECTPGGRKPATVRAKSS